MNTDIKPKKPKKHLSSSQLIILGFMGAILCGSFLLMLPFASKADGCASFLDALFTAVSAVCVTGLIVHDTATYWTWFGQFVILLLIQIGGMGVVTVAVCLARVSGKKIGLMQRSTMQEAISAHRVGGIVRLTGFILRVAIFIELAGTLLLLPVFVSKFKFKGIWYAVFHSISAFCNAGFDLMGTHQKYSSLTMWSGNIIVNIVIMLLIILGGIGFLTWEDIAVNKLEFKKYRMQSKVILCVSAILIILPAIYLFFVEFTKPVWDNVPLGEKILSTFFQAVTPRTAGFNTVDYTKFSESGILITIILMLIGGSPGSTAGGMKTTTVAVLFVLAAAVFRRKPAAECFGRRIPDETIHHVATILMLYFTLFITGGIVISCIEGLPILTCLFETASAIGTVGLTLGITPGLSACSKIILIGLMFFGRAGALTLVFAAFSGNHPNVSRLPQEKITVG